MEKIKLVVWDMDDTFWNGTISEGPVTVPSANVEHENPAEPGMCRSHHELNAVVDRVLVQCPGTRLVDMRRLVEGRKDLADNIRHYNREVYRRMADCLSDIVDRTTGGWLVRTAAKWRSS